MATDSTGAGSHFSKIIRRGGAAPRLRCAPSPRRSVDGPGQICGSNAPAWPRGTSICPWPVLSVSAVFGRVRFRAFPLSGSALPFFFPAEAATPADRATQYRSSCPLRPEP